MKELKILKIIATILIILALLTIIYGPFVILGIAPKLPLYIEAVIMVAFAFGCLIYGLFDIWKN